MFRKNLGLHGMIARAYRRYELRNGQPSNRSDGFPASRPKDGHVAIIQDASEDAWLTSTLIDLVEDISRCPLDEAVLWTTRKIGDVGLGGRAMEQAVNDQYSAAIAINGGGHNTTDDASVTVARTERGGARPRSGRDPANRYPVRIGRIHNSPRLQNSSI